MHKRFNSGFTLIELLVTMAIMAILATISIVSYMAVSIQSRDTRRQADITGLTHLLENFYQKNSEYPAGCLTVSGATPCVTYTSTGTTNSDPGSFTTANSTQINANITLSQLISLLPGQGQNFGDPTAASLGSGTQLFINNAPGPAGPQNYAYAGGISNGTASAQTYYVAWASAEPLGCNISVTLQPGQVSSYVVGYLSEVDHTWHLRNGAHGVQFQSTGGSGNNLSCTGSLFNAQWAQ